MESRNPASSLAAFLGLVLLALAAWHGLRVQSPPPAREAGAPLSAFSAGRALQHVQAIARVPHALGTPEHDHARDELMVRLRELGLNPAIQQGIGISRQYGSAGQVENIVARLPGSASTGAILLTAHYDSVPMGPGAGDDAAGIAAMLEVARILKAGPALKNDVILLLADGEELGLLGAEAFASHPAFAEVALVLNFEGRGNKGPSYLFETSAGNAELIRQATASDAPLVTNSMTYEVYKRLPNNTDFSVYRRLGKPGLNFAFIGGLTHYHTSQDTPENLALDSLQHHGESMLGLVRQFGGADLGRLGANHDSIYFTAPWGEVAYYTQNFAYGLVVIALILTLVATRRVRAQGIGLGQTALAALALLAVAALAGLLGHGYWQSLKYLNPPYHWLSNGEGYHTEFLVFAVLVIGFDLAARTAARFGAALGLAATWLFLILAAVCTQWLPGASMLLVWPALGAALALLVPNRGWGPLLQALPLAVVPLFALPLLLQLPTALTPSMLGPVGALCVLYVALLATVIHPLWHDWPGLSRLLGLGALVLTLAALALSRFDVDQKQPDHVMYLHDRSASQAWWLAAGSESDDWMQQFLSPTPEQTHLEALPYAWTRGVLRHEAPVLPLPSASVNVVLDRVQDGMRHLHLSVSTQAQILGLVADAGNPVKSVRINGMESQDLPFKAQFLLGKPGQEWTVELVLGAGEKLRLRLIQQFFGLPDRQQFPYHERGPLQMQTPLRQSDSRFTLDQLEF